MAEQQQQDHGLAKWREVESIVETYLVPELEPQTFANFELFETLGGDAESAVEGRPSGLKGSDNKMLRWAGNAFIYQMGFFRWPGEICCELKTSQDDEQKQAYDADDFESQLTDKQIYQLVIERMDEKGLKPKIDKNNMYKARPLPKVSSLIFKKTPCGRRRERSRSPTRRK
jgi:hypothetical protein